MKSIFFATAASLMLLSAQASAQTLTPEMAQAARAIMSQNASPGAGKVGAMGAADAANSAQAEAASDPGAAQRIATSAPRRPNEFQRFIQTTTGLALPILGETLFNRPYSPPAGLPPSPDYVLGPGDEIGIKVYSASVDVDDQLVITRDGALVLPKVGPINVAGTRVADLDRKVRQALSRILTDFNLYITVGRLRGIDIYVTGMAERPGKFSLTGTSTAISALFSTGGPSNLGTMRAIEVIRGGQVIGTIDLYRFMLQGDIKQDIPLRQGDVINIPRSGPQVALVGAIEQPSVIEMPPSGLSVGDALKLTGSLPPTTNPNLVYLQRLDPGLLKPTSLQQIDLGEAGRLTRLKDGDMLQFVPASLQTANMVTLRILGEPPVRMPIEVGARVSSVIPSIDALITRGTLVRRMGQAEQGSTGKVDAAVKAESGSGLETAESRGQIISRESADARFRDLEYKRLREATLSSEINWERALIERLDSSSLQPLILGFNLAQALERNPEEDLELQAGDIITVMRRQDVEGPALNTTRIVRIQGEVAKPGVYQIGTEETLKSLLQRAGGPTKEAYLFGTQLLRERVKTEQAKNIESIARQLEAQLRSESALSARETVGESGMLAMQQLAAQNRARSQQQIDRLRALQPSGRVALEMDTRDTSLPPIALEHGDEILIPKTPSNIFMAGAVINENALRFKPGRTLQDAMRQAGTLPNAETSQAFILRADGSALLPDLQAGTDFWSAGTVSRWFKGDRVQDIALMPGDTVVVPEKLTRETPYSIFVRGLKDWTQVLYQLGLGAAAVKTLKN